MRLEDFGDAQTHQLDIANQQKQDDIDIADQCASQNTDAAKKLQPKPWWHFW